MTIYLYIVYLVLAVSGSVLLSANNFNMIDYMFSSVPYIVYLPVLILRELLFMIILNVIIYLLLELNKKYLITILIFVIISSFLLATDYKILIKNFYSLYLLFPYYFQNIEYQSFTLELLCSMIELLILYGICKFILYRMTLRKRDVL